MALTGMSVKDWREALDFSTRKVKVFFEEMSEHFRFIIIIRRVINIMLRKEDQGEWRSWWSTTRR